MTYVNVDVVLLNDTHINAEDVQLVEELTRIVIIENAAERTVVPMNSIRYYNVEDV